MVKKILTWIWMAIITLIVIVYWEVSGFMRGK